MTFQSALAMVAAVFAASLAVARLLLKKHSPAGWCFSLGMAILAADSGLRGVSLTATPENAGLWHTAAQFATGFLPVTWLAFSVTYSRGTYGEFLHHWRIPLALALILPPGLTLLLQPEFLKIVLPGTVSGLGVLAVTATAGQALNIVLLIAFVLILMNLEQTFRSAVGTMRWRIKFVVLGLLVIFAARVYTRSQAVLFTGTNLALAGIEAGALLLGCIFMTVAYARTGLPEIDVYPSQAVLRSSVTLLFVGTYLFVVGVLARAVGYLGGVESFDAQALLVLVGMAALAVLLLSDRLRQRIHTFTARHFKKGRHDVLQVWRLFSREMASVKDQAGLCAVFTRLLSQTFSALTVTIWLIEENGVYMVFGASTLQSRDETLGVGTKLAETAAVVTGLKARPAPFDLDLEKETWAAVLRQFSATQFPTGGNRICVPFFAGDQLRGLAVLADRVEGIPYTIEEMDLLKCIADQFGAGLLNLRLTSELMVAKEFEAFQTISAFFVHDLKNAASSLGLMLQNLPVHFDDPEFRQDALRGIGNTVGRINHLIARLGIFRQHLELKPVETDLNQLIRNALSGVEGTGGVEYVKDLRLVPKVMGDPEQLQSVLTNLLVNAREATAAGGNIRVETGQHDGHAVVTVADSGCGMSAEFLKRSLFRPFQTTKKQGLGIGMFQTKMIVEAHRGTIQVESELAKGTTFRVLLPLPSSAR
jgi:putative PEP-CTERM system histidine kinase